MKKIIIYTIAIFNIINSVSFAGSFLDEQKRYSRVRTAIKEKDALIKQNIINNNIKLNEMNILITACRIKSIYIIKTFRHL